MTLRDKERGIEQVAEATIAAGFPKALLVFAVSRGADRQTLLERSNIVSSDLADPDAHIPLSRYIALFRSAIELCGDPALALHFGESVRMQDISIVGLVCEVAETTAEVGRQLNRYASLMIDEGPGKARELMRASPGPGGLWMEIVSEASTGNPLMIEAELTRLVCNTRAAFGQVAAFRAMRFPAPVTFGSDRNALLLDPAFATLRQPVMNRYVFGVLSERADALLKNLENSKTVRGRVEALLMPMLHKGDASMDAVAEKMGVSRQTLFRRLKDENATFERVLDDLRHRLALDYLGGRKVSVNETAYLVGFSDPAAFSRAFKRWTGTTPKAMRDGHR
jgi:AraC-like DNA-binding protein